ncbi:hypothetical protein N7491_004695 [Penicillium cf. griseofulvum]|uniref:Uncharacterized protein n=1 Tax=Penicillium cf. griseofulvum TaxID=2972120 RepID=A0A9W9J4V4_9EURO|nr:hypothetical protein N7472_007384 [Penicillium cf. griseofulvum]KAJ5434100.1 hypothetical protein N7491_004695 [Penicillium cf. griseofulvum]
MAVFQQPPSATLPPLSTTHYFMPQAAISYALISLLYSGHLAAIAINIPFPPILRLILSLFRLKYHSKNLPLIFRRTFFYLVVSTLNTSNHRITSESSYTSPIDTDNNRPFEPDSSKTDLTEPERSPLAGRTITRKKLSLKTRIKSLLIDLSNIERIY